jgi:hypothetical protein
MHSRQYHTVITGNSGKTTTGDIQAQERSKIGEYECVANWRYRPVYNLVFTNCMWRSRHHDLDNDCEGPNHGVGDRWWWREFQFRRTDAQFAQAYMARYRDGTDSGHH